MRPPWQGTEAPANRQVGEGGRGSGPAAAALANSFTETPQGTEPESPSKAVPITLNICIAKLPGNLLSINT